MYIYKTEVLSGSSKLFSRRANREDAEKLDELFNQRAKEGWELAAYEFLEEREVFIITFRREQ
ncbi:MAG: DUF4177 domain-containing protein [Lachnospiraceae bacterium]|nr:DUF4177 domain-containing protein [Lachnospiraceae bacterium]